MVTHLWSLSEDLANTHWGCSHGLGLFKALSHLFVVLPSLSLLSLLLQELVH